METQGTIYNLTGAPTSLALRKLGVFDPNALDQRQIQQLLYGQEAKLLGAARQAVAEQLAELAAKSLARYALIEGPVYLVSVLEHELRAADIQPVYVDHRTVRTVDADGKQRLLLQISGILGR